MLKKDLYCLSGCLGAAALFSTALLSNPHVVLAQVAQIATPAAGNALAAPAASVTPSAPTIPVTIVDGSQAPLNVQTSGATIADVLSGAGIKLGAQDRVTPSPKSAVSPNARIVVTRVHFEMDEVTKSIPFHTVFTMSRSVPAGSVRAGTEGVPGVVTLNYRVGYVNGKKTERWLVSRVVTRKPINKENVGGIRVADAAALPSRGGAYNRLRSLMMIATGYTPYEGSGTGRCATGMRAGYGVVAVDPRVIHLGSRLYVQGYGYAVAGDTGGAIRGHRIDLGSSSYRQAMDIGRRQVKVWVLSQR